MKTDLSHLPQDKQDELRHVTELIREAADPEMIILFGSHARGDWVEDRHEEDGILYEYVSDYAGAGDEGAGRHAGARKPGIRPVRPPQFPLPEPSNCCPGRR